MTVGYDGYGFNADELLALIRQLDSSRFTGFVYGSGFEARPGLLQKISEFIPLIGNAASTVAAIKTPAIFFAALQQLNINHPKTCSALPADDADAYISKLSGGSGGWHISYAITDGGDLPVEYYYQQVIPGRSVSLLFVANGTGIDVIGFNEQWCCPSADMPFRYGGAVGDADLPAHVRQQLVSAATALARTFHLRGLNSLDAIVQTAHKQAGNERVFVLEINPRLSATLDLYRHLDHSLFARHVSACLNQGAVDIGAVDIVALDKVAFDTVTPLSGQSHAHAIVYANHDLEIAAAVDWPAWVADNPARSSQPLSFSAHEPVCTVLADAANAETAKKLAQDRVEIIQNLLQSLNQKI